MTANWVFSRPGRTAALALVAAGGLAAALRAASGPDPSARDRIGAGHSVTQAVTGCAGPAGSAPSPDSAADLGRPIPARGVRVPRRGGIPAEPAWPGVSRIPPFAAAPPAASGDAWFGRDKARHFVASFIAAGAVSYAARRRSGVPRGAGLRIGLGVSLALSAVKEVRDGRSRTGQASWKDLAADAAGAAAGTALLGWW